MLVSGRVALLLPSIEMMVTMLGQSLALTCTHSNPRLMHFRTWCASNDSLYTGSVSSIHLPSTHKCHAYKKFNSVNVWIPQKRRFTCSCMSFRFIHFPTGMLNVGKGKTRVLLPSDNFYEKHTKTEDIGFLREVYMQCIFRRHISTAFANAY